MNPNLHATDNLNPRHVRLFRNGANQALRIPREFELDCKEAEIRREGESLVITPIANKQPSLSALLDSWQALDGDFDFPDTDVGLLPLDDITL